MKKQNTLILSLAVCLTTFSGLNNNKNNRQNQQLNSSTCNVNLTLKDRYSTTIHALGWSDDDESYSATDLNWGDYFSSIFDATANIKVTLKLYTPHPSGSFSIRNGDTGALLYCVNIDTSNSLYSYTITPACGVTYVVEIVDYSC